MLHFVPFLPQKIILEMIQGLDYTSACNSNAQFFKKKKKSDFRWGSVLADCLPCYLFNHTIIKAKKAAIVPAEVVKELEHSLEDNKRQEFYTSES